MRFECICLSVKDMEASKDFYQNLIGLEIVTDWGDNVSFKGGIALQQGFDELVGVPLKSVMTRSHNMELVFEADDFDVFVAKVGSYPKAELVKGGVIEQPWGQRVLHLYDLDGHILEIGEKMLQVIERLLAGGMSVGEVAEHCGMPVGDVEKYLRGEWS